MRALIAVFSRWMAPMIVINPGYFVYLVGVLVYVKEVEIAAWLFVDFLPSRFHLLSSQGICLRVINCSRHNFASE